MTTFAPHPVVDAAESRRSIRKYTPDTLTEAELRELLRLAGRAPSANNLQPWRVVVIRDPALKQELLPAAYNQAQVTGAPALLVIYSDIDDALAHIDETIPASMPPEQAAASIARVRDRIGGLPPAERAAWANAQTNIMLGYLLLIAASLGYATSPMLGFTPAEVKRILGLPAHATIAALVAIGHGAEPGFESRRHAIDRFVTFR